MPPDTEKQSKYTSSKDLPRWLNDNDCSLVFTSYDSHFLHLVGVRDDETISIVYRKFNRPMGLDYANGILYLASGPLIYECENSGKSGSQFDAVFIPRRSTLIGSVDIHEIKAGDGEIFFANTLYSCVATTGEKASFNVVWQPHFITALLPEDRCHLNGFAFTNDRKLTHVSVVGRSDCIEGWRQHRKDGGMILPLTAEYPDIITGLSMPHSPRWHEGKLWYLDSGRGNICCDDGREFFCPGFLRGLSFHNNHAIVTVSLPRAGVFDGLELENNIKKRGGDAWCGVLIVNLDSGAIVNWLRIEGSIRELFDIVVLKGVANPNILAPDDPKLLNALVTFQI